MVVRGSARPLDAGSIRAYAGRIEEELTGNVLPFWLRHAPDRSGGGFFGEDGADLRPDPRAPRGAVLTARILWTFSSAARRLGDRGYLDVARRARDDLVSRFWDGDDGGLFWLVRPEARPRKRIDDRKQVYAQAFGIYSLAELHRATGDGDALERAIELYRLVEAHARDRRHGGYLEAFTRAWKRRDRPRASALPLPAPKSLNTNLHVLEAFTGLLEIWPDPGLRDALAGLVDVMLTRFLDSSTRHLRVFLTDDWQPRSVRVSFGHDVELSWLLTAAAAATGDEQLARRARAASLDLARVTLERGVDADGGVFHEGDRDGIVDPRKVWWTQCEAAVGFCNAFRLSGDERFLAAATRTWDFVAANLVDRERGEWLAAAGDRRSPKIAFWKCPYHNGRACLELAERLRLVAAER